MKPSTLDRLPTSPATKNSPRKTASSTAILAFLTATAGAVSDCGLPNPEGQYDDRFKAIQLGCGPLFEDGFMSEIGGASGNLGSGNFYRRMREGADLLDPNCAIQASLIFEGKFESNLDVDVLTGVSRKLLFRQKDAKSNEINEDEIDLDLGGFGSAYETPLKQLRVRHTNIKYNPQLDGIDAIGTFENRTSTDMTCEKDSHSKMICAVASYENSNSTPTDRQETVMGPGEVKMLAMRFRDFFDHGIALLKARERASQPVSVTPDESTLHLGQ